MEDDSAPPEQDAGSVPPTTKAIFTDRELQLLSFAMQSLKTGPPEVSLKHTLTTSNLLQPCKPMLLSNPLTLFQIDYDKLAELSGMTNPKSASNAWAKIKTKLASTSAENAGAKTPKKTSPRKKNLPKINTEALDDKVAGEDAGSPSTPRKRGPKKAAGESPPKRARKGQKAEDASPSMAPWSAHFEGN